MPKIAVIQTAYPGDVILSTPLFEAVKATFPGCGTVAVVRPESVCLLENNPFVDEIEAFDKYGADRGLSGIARLAGRLKGCGRAYIIQRHLRSAIIAYFARIPVRVGFACSSARMLYTHKIVYRENLHEVERCLSLLGAEAKRYRPRLYLGEDSISRADELIKSAGIYDDFAVIAPGSIWPTKRYPYFTGVIHLLKEKLNLPVVLIGGAKDARAAEEIGAGSIHKVHNLAGATSLAESAAIMSKAKIVITNDSAPAHIAAAVGAPVVAIFGSTVPRFGFAPYSGNSAVVEIGDLYCRPCGRHGAKKCPEKHFRCMLDLQPAKVIEAVLSLLAE